MVSIGSEEDFLEILDGGKIENDKLPHLRQDCTVHPFATLVPAERERKCSNCYCYVCDAPAAACESWNHHCHANSADKTEKSYWLQEKKRFQSTKREREGQSVRQSPAGHIFNPV